ncbi:MAG: hypothetical protein WCA22_03340 [Candidatus Binatus sp.]
MAAKYKISHANAENIGESGISSCKMQTAMILRHLRELYEF